MNGRACYERHTEAAPVCGVKNSGKTTLIEALIPRLNQLGIKTAVIKHDGHSYVPDNPGTDSFRFFQAGACGTAVFDGEKYSVTRRAAVGESELKEMFCDADLIILEGFKSSEYPKIEVVRSAVSQAPVSAGETCLAYVSDADFPFKKPVFALREYEKIADFIAAFVRGDNYNA